MERAISPVEDTDRTAAPVIPSGPGLGDVRTRRKHFHGAAAPGGAVDDRLAVGSEARGDDAAALKRQAPELDRRGRFSGENVAREESEAEPEKESEERRNEPAAAPQVHRLGLFERSGGGGLREMVADAPEVAREILRRGVALLGVLGEATFDQPPQGPWRLRRDLRERLGLLLDDRDERLGAGLSLECALAGRHLVEDRAEGELVGVEVDGLAARLLGRHVAGRAHDGAGLCGGRHRGWEDGRFLR